MVKLVILPILVMVILAATSTMAQDCRTGPRPPEANISYLSRLTDLTGSEFNTQYMQVMYQVHGDMQALAELELKSTVDAGLRQLSQNIRREQNDLNRKLEGWYKQRAGQNLSKYCAESNVDYQRLQATKWQDFDDRYVTIMLDYLKRSQDAARLAMQRSTMREIKNQAKIVVDTTTREITALQRWQQNLPMFED